MARVASTITWPIPVRWKLLQLVDAVPSMSSSINSTRSHSRFTSIPHKSPSELEEDLDQLLGIAKLEAIASRETPVSDTLSDSTKSFDNSERASFQSPILIENYLKELKSIPHQKIDNSDLLN